MVTGVVPHVGGPIVAPGAPTVLIEFLPAARMTDMLTCVGPPDMIMMGSPTVLIQFLMAARMGDPTVHGGVIILGAPTVMIGEVGMGMPESVVVTPLSGGGGGAAAAGGAGTGAAAAAAMQSAAQAMQSVAAQALASNAQTGTALIKPCPG
jgi:uncharacterized Zn-binding protein involved in type VI secretion